MAVRLSEKGAQMTDDLTGTVRLLLGTFQYRRGHNTETYHVGEANGIGQYVYLKAQATTQSCQLQLIEVTRNGVCREQVETIAQLWVEQAATQVIQADLQCAAQPESELEQ